MDCIELSSIVGVMMVGAVISCVARGGEGRLFGTKKRILGYWLGCGVHGMHGCKNDSIYTKYIYYIRIRRLSI